MSAKKAWEEFIAGCEVDGEPMTPRDNSYHLLKSGFYAGWHGKLIADNREHGTPLPPREDME